MAWVYRATLAAWVMAAGVAAAQIPRDPVGEQSAGPVNVGSGQSPPPFVTNQSEVEVPFSVKAGTTRDSQPASVRIFVSWDRGKTWHLYEERKPDDARFKFRPRQDGEFWFATQTIDRTGRPDSAEPRSPQLCVIFDRERPRLLVQANVDGSGSVQLSWSAADANLSPTSLKLEYQDAAGNAGPWQSIAYPPPATSSVQQTGATTFSPAVSSRTINLRAEIADAAGNISYYSEKLSLLPRKAKAGDAVALAPAHDPTATRWPTENPHVGATAGTQLASKPSDSASPPADEAVQIPNLVANPYVGPGRLVSSQPITENLPPPPQTQPTTSAGPPPQNYSVPPPAVAELPQTGSGVQDLPRAVEANPAPMRAAEIMPAPQPAEPIEPPTAQRPRLTNSRRFSLDYDVQTVGPEGLSAVELWGTNDGGRTWIKWGADPDRASPFDVEVSREAVYGFRIVVVGKNGLATSTPQPGEAADIWVGVDLTRPTAKLVGAMYGQGEAAGKLDIRWEASDGQLGNRPIALAIADRPDGPFTTIAAGLPNTGQFFWEYDPRSPRQIYLRLEARDEAGNITIDQLNEPIKVEGLEPKGQIRGFSAK